MAAEPAFAAQVEAWRARLAPLGQRLPEVAPPADLWQRVLRSLPANDNSAMVRGLRFWRGATAASLTPAAASIGRHRHASADAHPAAASWASCLTPAWSARRRARPCRCSSPPTIRTCKALIVTSLVSANNDPGHVHELWVIPADGKPRPLSSAAGQDRVHADA